MHPVVEDMKKAEAILAQLGYSNVHVVIGDGTLGLQEHAPYDKIIVAAAPETVPAMLVGQLKPGGRMVIPGGGEDEQHLCLLPKGHDDQIETKMVLQVRFTPLIRSH